MNVTKAKLDTVFADEGARLQPMPGYLRLLRESVLGIWKERQAPVRTDFAQAQRTADAIQQMLDRLDYPLHAQNHRASAAKRVTR